MAESIVRLRVDSKEYDNKIKRAEQGLLSLERELNKTGKSFEKADKDTVAYIGALGKMQTVSMSARGKVGELSSAFVNLSQVYGRMTDEAKKGEAGKALSSSLEQIKQRTIAAKHELEQLNGQLNVTKSNSGSIGGGGGNMKQMLGGIAGQFGMSAQMFTTVGAAATAAGVAFKLAGDNIRTALNFEKSMSLLSSLTGKTGRELEQLKEYSIELGSTSTLTASQVADAFRLIGSQQPQLLESGYALKEVTKNAITLSEAAGIDLATAAQTLSVSVNQMGGDSGNAARFINVLAAASQKGAGDISWLGEAITKSGTTAKAVGTEYEELVANLEQLAKAGYDASTAGTALRSIIMNLEKKASNEFKPSVVGLTQAFQNLSDANLTLTGYQELAGKMFAAQAKALAEAAGEAKKMTEEITGTNIAEEQAKTNTDNLDGALKSLSSAWEGLNLHVNSSSGGLKSFIDWCTDTVRVVDSLATSAGRASAALKGMNGGGNGQRTKVDKQIDYLAGSSHKDAVYHNAIANYNKQILDFQNAINKGGLNSLMAPIYQARIDALQQMKNEYMERAKTVINPAPRPKTAADYRKGLGAVLNPAASAPAADAGGKSDIPRRSAGGGGRTTTIEEVFPEGSMKALQKEMQELQKAQGLVTDAQAWKDYQQQIDEVTKKMNTLKGVTEADAGSLKGLSDEMAELRKERELMSDPISIAVQDEKIKQVQEEIDRLNGKVVTVEVDVDDLTPFEKLQESIRVEISDKNVEVDANSLHSLMKVAIENGIEDVDMDFSSLQEKMGEGLDIPDEAWTSLEAKINEKLKEMGIDPISLDMETGNLQKAGKDAAKGWQEAAGAISSVGSALQQVEDPSVKIAGIVAQAIANIALAFSKADIKEGSTGHIWTWIAATAAGVATMVSTIASIKSATSGYAEGGIVKGTTYSGDQIFAGEAMVNAGELVLNKAQQGNLATALRDNRGGGGGVELARVSGEQIYVAMNNFLRRSGRGELVTWKY